VRAKKLLDQARREGRQLPIVFSTAEETTHLFPWGSLEEVDLKERTYYTFSGLQALAPLHRISTLHKASDDQPLSDIFFRPYAICKTPNYLQTEPGIPLTEELVDTSGLMEGAFRRVAINAYERNPEARRQCIAHYGAVCCICGFDFGKEYGDIAKGFIHVHHLRSLSELKAEYEVDPIKDMRPVCPNCHAVLHLGGKSFSIEEVKLFLRR